jgi:hypothetical protein
VEATKSTQGLESHKWTFHITQPTHPPPPSKDGATSGQAATERDKRKTTPPTVVDTKVNTTSFTWGKRAGSKGAAGADVALVASAALVEVWRL